MGKSYIADIPGYKDRHSHVLGSFASDYASTNFTPLHTIGRDSTFTGAYWIPSADQSAAGSTNYRTAQIINRGSVGTGTKVLASKILSASMGSHARQALTLGVASDLDLSDADVLTLQFLIAGNGAATIGGCLQLEYT